MSSRKLILFLITALSALSIITLSSCPAQATARLLSSDTLLCQSKQWDRQLVRFRGEVIGDIMLRGTHCWINVNDGSQALGVYCPTELVKPIRYVGDYRYSGDIVEIIGTFHRACPQHGGELDIHAEALKIIRPGARRPHTVIIPKLYLAMSLFSCTLLIMGLYVYRKRLKPRRNKWESRGSRPGDN